MDDAGTPRRRNASVSATRAGLLTGQSYFLLYVGKPNWPVANDVGLATNGWAADWIDGLGPLSQIVDSRVIQATVARPT